MSSGLDLALRLLDAGILRVDADAGLVYRKYTTPLYEYERPIGALNSSGYVLLTLAGRGGGQVYAHRLIWLVATGETLGDSLVINHKNGVKHDNRIANLELVTNAENIRHAYDTGLAHSGERHYSAKLSDEDVRRIVALSFAEGTTTSDLAIQYGVSESLIGHVRTGNRRWRLVA